MTSKECKWCFWRMACAYSTYPDSKKTLMIDDMPCSVEDPGANELNGLYFYQFKPMFVDPQTILAIIKRCKKSRGIKCMSPAGKVCELRYDCEKYWDEATRKGAKP